MDTDVDADPLALFDAAVIDEQATSHEVEPGALREGLRAVQALAEYHLGVDGLVYEWRNAPGEDPLVERTAERWTLVVETRVWRDFGDRCELAPSTLRAVMAVHAATVEAAHDPVDLPLGDPMVLARS